MDVRLRSELVLGSGLELDGEVLQLSAFRSENGDSAPPGGSHARALDADLRGRGTMTR